MNEELIDCSLEDEDAPTFDVGDIELSQYDIEVRDHCGEKDTWEHAIGYLMYAANFPTRIDVADITHAMEVVFPERSCEQQRTFQVFYEYIISFRETIKNLDQVTQDQLIDQAYYNFARKIRRWLARGIDEYEEPKNSETKIKDNFIYVPPVLVERKRLYAHKNERYENAVTGKVWYKKVRQCPRCGKRLEYLKRYCSVECKFGDPKLVRDYVVDEKALLEKYFPNARINGT